MNSYQIEYKGSRWFFCFSAVITFAIVSAAHAEPSDPKVDCIIISTNAGKCTLDAAQHRTIQICIESTSRNQLPSVNLVVEDENETKNIDSVSQLIGEELPLVNTEPNPFSLGFMVEQLIAFENLSTNVDRTKDNVERILQNKSDNTGKLIFLSFTIVFSDGTVGLIRINEIRGKVTLSIVDGQFSSENAKPIFRASLNGSELILDKENRIAICQLKLLSSANRVVQNCFPIKDRTVKDANKPPLASKKGALIRIDRFQNLDSKGEPSIELLKSNSEYLFIHLNDTHSFQFNAQNGELSLFDHNGDQDTAKWFKKARAPIKSAEFLRDLEIFEDADRDIRFLAFACAINDWADRPGATNNDISSAIMESYLITVYFDDQSVFMTSSAFIETVSFDGLKLEWNAKSQTHPQLCFSNVAELKNQVKKEDIARLGYACDKPQSLLEPFAFWKKEMNFILANVIDRKKDNLTNERSETIFNLVEQFSESSMTVNTFLNLDLDKLAKLLKQQKMQPAGLAIAFDQFSDDPVVYLDAYNTLLILNEPNNEFKEIIRLDHSTKVEDINKAVSAILDKRKRRKSIVVMINVDSNLSMAHAIAIALKKELGFEARYFFASEEPF